MAERLRVLQFSYGESLYGAERWILTLIKHLDPELIEQLIGTIRELKATVIVISQAILPALACCKRAAVLNEGQMARCGPAIEIAKDRELLGRCGLDFHHYREIWRQLENGASPG